MESSAGDAGTFAREARTSAVPHHLGALNIIVDTSFGFPLHNTQDPGVLLDAPSHMARNLRLLGSSLNTES
jgi:hypothetical protein